jgi:hypothetical protein
MFTMLKYITQEVFRNKSVHGFFKGSKEVEITRPHISNQTCDWLWQASWEVMDYLPYSSDLTPSDFYLFAGMQFEADTDVKQASATDI